MKHHGSLSAQLHVVANRRQTVSLLGGLGVRAGGISRNTPTISDPQEPAPAYWKPACLNDVGQILISATYMEPVQINRRKTEERNIVYAYLREADGVSFTPLGPSFAGNRLGNRLAENGSVYSANYTADLSAEFIPKCWTMEQGWSTISPLQGWIPIVSKAEAGKTEVAIRGSGTSHVVYREGWGSYPIEVVQAQQTGGLELWQQANSPPMRLRRGEPCRWMVWRGRQIRNLQEIPH
ncbi:MAG: hypothetical protein R3F19_11880 [Verrucomicrobiales bacterium]